MSCAEVLERSGRHPREHSASGPTILGYIYPHTPLELFLAHGIIPSLVRANPNVQGGFEASLQTFSCSLTRNLFSQRSSGTLSGLSGLMFPNNTCDSLHNVADVWRHRFPEDKVFKLTYPVARLGEHSIQFLAEELRILSESLKNAYGRPLHKDNLLAAVSLVNDFRDAAQTLYSCRVVDPSLVSYSAVARMTTEFLVSPNLHTLDQIGKSASTALRVLEERGQVDLAKSLRDGLLSRKLDDIETEIESNAPRILVTGGMVEPHAIASLFRGTAESGREVVVLDLLSLGFKTVFTPRVILDGDPFVAISRSILGAPAEPTQEGLADRLEFLKQLLSRFSINGLLVCEQSFCDPDQFEAPSIAKLTSDMGVPAVRLPMDPELSDRARLEGRIQSFLETLEGGQT